MIPRIMEKVNRLVLKNAYVSTIALISVKLSSEHLKLRQIELQIQTTIL